MQTPRLLSAEYIDGYRIRLRFEDGHAGILDLEGELWGEVFAPLREQRMFRAFRIDADLATLVWPTGADLAPEYLYDACH